MIVVLLTASLLAAGPSRGPDSVLVLPEVRVERERALSEARRRLPTAFVAEVRVTGPGHALTTLSEALAEVAGVRVEQYGGLGAFSTVSLRGAPPGQVIVFLDGVPLTSAAHGVVSLADLPATAVERIEVYRGLSPLGLGVASPGGAINVVTVAAPELREAHLARGAFGTWEARASLGGRRGVLGGLVHAGLQGSRGDYLYPDDNGTPFNPADDSLTRRVNDRFQAATLLGSLSWRAAPRLLVTAREELFQRAQGLPGLGAVPAYHSHLDFGRARGRLEIASEPHGAAPSLRLSGGLERERTRFRDRAAELGLGAHDTDDRLAGQDLRLEAAWPELPFGFAVSGSGSVRDERARLHDAGDGFADPPPSERRGAGASLALQARPLGDRLTLHAAQRWDRLRDRLRWTEVAGGAGASEGARRLASPQIGLALTLGRGFELRANASDARRAPEFLELFGNQGSVAGNPGLAAERGRSADLGIVWAGSVAGREARIECAHFESRAEDLIVYVRHSQSSVRAENVSRARIAGEEVSLRLRTAPGLLATGSLTAMRSRDEGPVPYWNGRRLPQRPAWQSDARLEWTRGPLGASADLQAIGDDYLDRANLQLAPARTLLGASVWYSLHDALRFTLEGRNLGDDRISDVGGFPLPGRAFFASCDVRLAGGVSQVP